MSYINSRLAFQHLAVFLLSSSIATGCGIIKSGPAARQAGAKTTIGAMVNASRDFWSKSKKMPSTIAELQLGVSENTDAYRFEIKSSGEEDVEFFALPKDDDTKAYTSAVVVDSSSSIKKTIAIICESNEKGVKNIATPSWEQNKSLSCSPGTTLIATFDR